MPDAEDAGGTRPPPAVGAAGAPARGRPQAGPRVAAAVFAAVVVVLGVGWLVYGVGIVGWACSYGSASDLCGGGAARLGDVVLAGGAGCVLVDVVLACAARVRSRAWWWVWGVVNVLAAVAWGIGCAVLV